MTPATIPAIIIGLALVAWFSYELLTAPLGYEDSEGWHAGEPCSDYDEECE
jgi:hypothetical protein